MKIILSNFFLHKYRILNDAKKKCITQLEKNDEFKGHL